MWMIRFVSNMMFPEKVWSGGRPCFFIFSIYFLWIPIFCIRSLEIRLNVEYIRLSDKNWHVLLWMQPQPPHVLSQIKAERVNQLIDFFVDISPGIYHVNKVPSMNVRWEIVKQRTLSKNNMDGFKRKQTSFYCPDCNVSLCVPDCFKLFHTKKKLSSWKL